MNDFENAVAAARTNISRLRPNYHRPAAKDLANKCLNIMAAAHADVVAERDRYKRAGLHLADRLAEFLPAQVGADGCILHREETAEAWWQLALAETEEADNASSDR